MTNSNYNFPDRQTNSKWRRRAGCCDACDNLKRCRHGLGLCEDANRRDGGSVRPTCTETCRACDPDRDNVPGFKRMDKDKFLLMCL